MNLWAATEKLSNSTFFKKVVSLYSSCVSKLFHRPEDVCQISIFIKMLLKDKAQQ
jgi:hypothetical protein